MMSHPVARGAWLALFAGLLLSVCGRDHYASIRNLRATGDIIICLGDSLTKGVGAQMGEDYPSVLADRLGRPIVNAGHPGNTTADALTRLQDVLKQNPRLVIVFLGGNDFLRQVPLQETKRNLEEIIERIQNHGAMVAIVGMKLGLFTDEYGPLFESIAERLGALYIPQLFERDSNGCQVEERCGSPQRCGLSAHGRARSKTDQALVGGGGSSAPRRWRSRVRQCIASATIASPSHVMAPLTIFGSVEPKSQPKSTLR